MKCHRSLLALSVGMLLVVVTACQRDTNGVQAAREETAPAANPEKPGITATMDNRTDLSPEDRDRAFKIEQAHIEEIDLGRYVRDKTSNGDVKAFAKMMIDDHNDALNKLQDILKDQNVNRSTTVKPQDEAANMSALQNTSGAEFDRQYMSMMVQDHRKDLDELRSAEASVENPELKGYIQGLIPVVQKHMDKAQELENNLNQATGHKQ